MSQEGSKRKVFYRLETNGDGKPLRRYVSPEYAEAFRRRYNGTEVRLGGDRRVQATQEPQPIGVG